MKEFDYGKISISRRFECESTKIDKVIKIALVKKRKGFIHESFWEIQVLYVDESGVRQCDLFLRTNKYFFTRKNGLFCG